MKCFVIEKGGWIDINRMYTELNGEKNRWPSLSCSSVSLVRSFASFQCFIMLVDVNGRRGDRGAE